jgi:hypothetical protein
MLVKVSGWNERILNIGYCWSAPPFAGRDCAADGYRGFSVFEAVLFDRVNGQALLGKRRHSFLAGVAQETLSGHLWRVLIQINRAIRASP